jgi:hypothetical protein
VARQNPPDDALLTLIAWSNMGDPGDPPTPPFTAEVYRSPDAAAIADAMAKLGEKPQD